MKKHAMQFRHMLLTLDCLQGGGAFILTQSQRTDQHEEKSNSKNCQTTFNVSGIPTLKEGEKNSLNRIAHLRDSSWL